MRLVLVALAAAAVVYAQGAGDAGRGRAVFDARDCLRCHALDGRGGALGPELTEAGIHRSPASLRLALTDPDAEIAAGYLTITAVTGPGLKVRGIRLNEDDYSIQIRDTAGNLRTLLKSGLRDLRREPRSLMPSYAGKLSPQQLDDLVAWLGTLRGVAPPPAAAPRTRAPAPVLEGERAAAWLTRPGRDAAEQPEQLLDALEVQPGSIVADVGAGAGYYTWRLASRVGASGRVYAVEIQPSMLDRIGAEVRRRALTNVELVLGGESDPRLPEGRLDLALLVNAYHEFTAPEAMLAALRRSLRPEGRLVLVEYRREDPFLARGEHKLSVEEARREIEPLGFRLARVLEFLPTQHVLVFTRDGLP